MATTTTSAENNNNQQQQLPRLRYEIGSIVVPGDRLGAATTTTTTRRAAAGGAMMIRPGPGTYLRQGQLYASTAGKLLTTTITTNAANDDDDDKQKGTTATVVVVIVQPTNHKPFVSSLAVGQVVLCRVVRLAFQQAATVEIVAVQQQQQSTTAGDEGLLRYRHEGIIRREDAWSAVAVASSSTTEQQQQQPPASPAFLPGDLVVARILSLGDTRRYFLTTAEPHMGVIYALSSHSGKPMVPTSWCEMQCPETGRKEARKVAKPKSFAMAQSDNHEDEQQAIPMERTYHDPLM